MSLLTITKSVALRVMKQAITSAATSADPKILQMVELINEDGQELASRHSWQILTNESNFTTSATETQGLITALAGADFNFILNETMWNRSQLRPVFGPRSAMEWQQLKAQFTTGPWSEYRIRGNAVIFIPVPAAGQSIYFEWVSKNWCTDSTGMTSARAMTADGDVAKLDERLLTLGAIWRWKAAQKLDYEDDYDKCEKAIADAISRDGSKPILTLGSSGRGFAPGILVQAGNFTL